MAFSPAATINISAYAGVGITGLTGGITTAADTAPQYNGKQYSINATGLTGLSGVVAHSLSTPHTINMVRPITYRLLPTVNPVTGILRNVPKNTFTLIHRKSVVPLAGQAPAMAIERTSWEIPAGSETADLANLKAMYQSGLLVRADQKNGIMDVFVTGTL